MVFSLQGNIRTNLLVKGLVLDDHVNTKLYLVNVFTLLCNGPTDSGIIEQVVLYVLTDPETFKAVMTFLKFLRKWIVKMHLV